MALLRRRAAAQAEMAEHHHWPSPQEQQLPQQLEVEADRPTPLAVASPPRHRDSPVVAADLGRHQPHLDQLVLAEQLSKVAMHAVTVLMPTFRLEVAAAVLAVPDRTAHRRQVVQAV